ncbi:MAG: hypothetical protein P9L92_13135 [Candidatus Electryonea clarkiae]|nr:hypothetical protein [Candidatus Electryonea clarkiae]MDP8289267.1 hypothetical protein [Candidatus Electryonea clarkiae]
MGQGKRNKSNPKWVEPTVVRPLQGREFMTIILRGLAPTAIHVIPLQGNSKGSNSY